MSLNNVSRCEDLTDVKFGGNLICNEKLFKILVVGDYGVGKTAIVRRFTETTVMLGQGYQREIQYVFLKCNLRMLLNWNFSRYSSNYKITIGADFSMKTLQWNLATKVTLQLWDIAGHERFGNMTRIYYKYAVGAVIVFDVSRGSTFLSVEKWLKDVREKVTLQDGEPIPVILLANKCDIEGALLDMGNVVHFCRENGIDAWYFTSAKENINIDDAISHLVDQIFYSKTIDEVKSDSIIMLDKIHKEESIEENHSEANMLHCC